MVFINPYIFIIQLNIKILILKIDTKILKKHIMYIILHQSYILSPSKLKSLNQSVITHKPIYESLVQISKSTFII